MAYFLRIPLFVIAGFTGFVIFNIVYYTGTFLGFWSIQNIASDPARFSFLFGGTMIAWLVGVFLSIGYFFSDTAMRFVLLSFSLVFPFVFSLTVLLM